MYDVIRAWKDEDYRDEVGADPGAHPSGIIDLTAIRPSAYDSDPEHTETPGKSLCVDSMCADICSVLYCFDAVRSVIWDDPVLNGI